MCGDARGAVWWKQGGAENPPALLVSLCRAGYASTRALVRKSACVRLTSDADMGGGICARQLARSSRGLFGAVLGGQPGVMGGQQSMMGKGLLRMLSTETRADKIHIQAEREKTQPARWDIFTCLHLA